MARWFLYVFFYSLAGCALEKLYARATHSSRQIRKGFLLLPLCPVYGLAMAAVLAVAGPADGFLWLALVGGLICTGVEYLVHLFYEAVFGICFWAYSLLRGHVQGRICPRFALIWGVLSAIAVRWVHPAVAAIAEQIPPELVFLLWVVLAADCVLTAEVLLHSRDTQQLTLRAVLAQTRASSQSEMS